MSALQKTFTNPQGQPLSGHTVRITRSRDGQPAVVYTVSSGGQGVQYPSHNIELGDDGALNVWLADSLYDLAVYLGATLVTTFYRVQVGSSFVTSTGSFHSRAEAVTAAAVGAIPAYVNTIKVQGFSSAFDRGSAQYSRVTSGQLAAYSLSDAALAIATFPDASGDTWVLDERDPNITAVGIIGQPLGVAPIETLDYDKSASITALSEHLFKVLGGYNVIRYPEQNFYLHNDLLLDEGVGLSGEYNGREPPATSDLETVAGIHSIPGFIIRSIKSIKVSTGFHSDYLCIKRAGITTHTDLLGALNAQKQFAGTGLTKRIGSARNVSIGQFVAYGFAFGMDAWKMHGIRVGDLYGDCATLAMLRDSGETGVFGESGLFKRKPALTTNDAIAPRTVVVTGIFNSGGQVGLTLAEDGTAMGLTTNQRVGNNKLPAEIVNNRYTVTVLTATSVRLEGTTWLAGYSSFVPTERTSISFQPGCASKVLAFYNASGKIGVQISLAMPFQPGHLALLGANALSVSGMHNVLTRVSATDFVLDKAWDAGLAATDVTTCEFAAMPNARYHSDVVPYWGTNAGFGGAAVNSDGIRVNFGNKGGSGFFCDAASAHIVGSNEGPQVGELDYGPTDTTGLMITQPRMRFTGDFKSTGYAVDIALETGTDSVLGYGVQATDGGRGSLKLSTGSATLIHFRVKGLGRIVLNSIGGLDILEGNVQPANLAGNSAADIQRTALRWRTTSTVNQVAGTWAWWAWDAAGAAVNVMNVTSSGVSLTAPLSAPRKGFTSTGATGPGGAAVVSATDNNCDIVLTTNTAGIVFDATAASDRFRFVVRNYRPGGDWTIPTTGWGTGVVLRFSRGLAHTKLLDKGEATFTIEDVGGTRYLTVRGDTA